MNVGKKKLVNVNFFIAHRDYFNNFEFRKGGGDNLANDIFKSDYLSLEISHGSFSKKNYFSFIIYDNKKKKILLNKKFSNNLRVFKYIIIIFYTYLFKKRKNFNFFNLLCIDPISTLIGIILKNKNSNKLLFHITDYSEKRFDNKILNFIYQTIFKLSLNFSSFITSPSKKLIKKFNNKIFYLPNSPKLKTKKIYKNKKNDLLLFIPKIDDGINLEVIMDSLEILKRKKIDIKFLITGSFSNKNLEFIIRKKVEKRRLKKNMLFLGFIKDNKKIIKLLNNSKIGVTTYNVTDRHNYYKFSDSLKIRQYAEFGLPILTEGLTPLSKEVVLNKFGFIFRNSKDLSNKIIKIIFKNQYKHLSKNSKVWALKNSREKFVNKLKKQLNI